MAAESSSSRRKHHEKHSKSSSEVRRRRSRSRKRSKSKKLRRRDVSLSSSDDDSRTEDSLSVSSSDSEDDYRRRAHSHTRGSRKRVGRSSLSRDVDKDSSNRRKRKGSKWNSRLKARKKTRGRSSRNVHSRKDGSVSSASSVSQSCSTCHGESGSSGESEFERSRGRSEQREKDKRNSGKMRNGRNKCRYRSRSSSSCSGCSNQSSSQSKERLRGENYSRSLRSVLTVTKQLKEKDVKDWYRDDDDRAEIIPAYDEYPSCRSNDSYDEGRKREPAYHPHVVSEKKRRFDDAKGEGNSTKIKTTELIESGKEDGGVHGGRDRTLVVIQSTEPSTQNRSELSVGTGSSEGGDLESFLRQKALENLKKFRGRPHTNTKSPKKDGSGIDGQQPSAAKAETIQNKYHMEESGRVVGARQVASRNVIPTMGRKTTSSSRKDGLIPDEGHESRAKLDDVCPVMDPLDWTTVTGKLTENNNPSFVIDNKFRPVCSTIRCDSSDGQSILKQEPTPQESPKGKLLETKNVAVKSITGTLNAAPGNRNSHGAEVNKTCGSAAPEASFCLNSTTGEHGPNELQDEAKGSSQFEQKTMSVMRGGEMVQVSYKVYIPKKAPALARRQLRQ